MDRSQKIQRLLIMVIHQETMELCDLASLLGMMVSCQEVVSWSRFHLRPLQKFLRPYQRNIAQRTTMRLMLPKNLRSKLRWWLSPTRFTTGASLREPSRTVVTTDASLYGWGAHTGQHLTQGVWTPEEQSYSINLLELRAVKLVLLCFQQHLQGSHVLIHTDNMTAKAYINRQGGTRFRKLNKEAAEIIIWAESHLKSLQAVHIPGLSNVLADRLTKTRRERMVLTQRSFQHDMHQVWDASGGPICDQPQQADQEFFLQTQRTGSDGNRCSKCCLAPTTTSVCISSSTAYVKSHSESHTAGGRFNLSGATLAAETLVSGPSETIHTETVATTIQRRSLKARRHRTPESPVVTTDYMEIERERLLKRGYRESVVNTMLSSRKDSTHKIYNRTWKKIQHSVQLNIETLRTPQFLLFWNFFKPV